ncbi:hypothetical protein LLEC1_06511 [Akanthomyces lecanii]|uniref:Pop1 N-terminal domain-containing protein n=1 Tax=Cordyceps confragosa TaxID=2714763 RepID=A0A179IHZ7_CORDF|nr:hypothetical protein LLEC1_06511 [Akanthomyces lecanii]
MGNEQAPAGPGGPGQGKKKTGSASSGGRNDNPQAARRAKVHLARNIPVEPAQSALKDGELDLQAFVAAHEFEIRSLEQSMATSKAVGSSRAFQQPRRRKPTTTRARLRAETAKRLRLLAARTRRRKLIAKGSKTADKAERPPTQRSRPKIRRNELNEPPLPPARFRKRQIHKTWLPTHLWHAKRARMTPPNNPLWRFAIPLTPSERIYRPTHRSQGERGTLVWDTSYMSTIGLYGHEGGLSRVLKRLGFIDAAYWNGKSKKWLEGTQSRSATIMRDQNGRPRPICPCTVLWNPQPLQQNQSSTQRQAFLRMHPSAFKEVFDELLRLTKMETPRLYIEDLRFEIGSIELTGPASTEALLAVLTPHPDAEGSALNQGRIFESLHGLTNPSALAANVTLAFAIQDPRLRYPPRRLEGWQDDRLQEKLMENIVEWPVERQLDSNMLFDRDARHKGSALPSQQAICKRRSETTAGAFLEPTKSDPQIPLTLLACRSASGTQTQGSWTLMLPWKCVLPVWHSLVHCPLISGGNPRFAGVNESMQVALERGVPWFPADYPGTDAGADWEATQRAKRRKDYDKRPKSKRTEWTSLDLGAGRKGELGDGLTCDFELLFGLKPESGESNAAETDPGDAMQGVETTTAPGASKVNKLSLLNQVSKTNLQAHLDATSPQALPANAIASVRIMIVGRGVATSCARIYRLPRPSAAAPESSNVGVPSTVPHGTALGDHVLPFNLRAQWLAKLFKEKAPSKTKRKGPNALDMDYRKRQLAQTLTAAPAQYPPVPANHDAIDGHHPLVPDAEDLIGFVTSGSYNMAHGRGTAVGAISVEKVLLDLQTTPKEAKLCIVRNAGENVGWLARWELV